jgi:endonuclease/exonuclease/phosphatase family metal-dependent hydrolase
MQHGNVSRKIARGLKTLRARIKKAKIPPTVLDKTLNLATWNIRDFGKKRRKKASIHYIAEILNQFDLIGITELRDNVSDLYRVMEILGRYWRVVYSDYSMDRGGNRERVAYLYDKRAVAFTGLAAEADPPRKKRTVKVNKKKVKEYVPLITWWRSPFIASFRAGDFDFILITAHIRWDKSGGETSRKRALKLLADWVAKRRKEKNVIDKDIIVMGDFNIPKIDDELFKAVTNTGLKVPKALRGKHGSNLVKDKRYDQILHFPNYTKCFTDKGGVLDFYHGDHHPLFRGEKMTKGDFTYQISDHLPLWVQLDTDIDDERLDQILNR